MSNIDLVCAWPIGFDYPLFRQFIRENRYRFHRVVIVWTDNHNGLDLQKNIEQVMAKDDIAFLQAPSRDGDQDWRDVAMKKALSYSQSQWIFFTEQDFFPKEGFWDFIDTAMRATDMVYVNDNGRIHPCCFFIKRKVLELTSMNFGAKPEDWGDHFGLIQKELEEMKDAFLARSIPNELYYHMNGLTHNLFLTQRKQKVNYKPEEFKAYLKDCKEAKVESID